MKLWWPIFLFLRDFFFLCSHSIATAIPARVLLPVITNCYTKLLEDKQVLESLWIFFFVRIFLKVRFNCVLNIFFHEKFSVVLQLHCLALGQFYMQVSLLPHSCQQLDCLDLSAVYLNCDIQAFTSPFSLFSWILKIFWGQLDISFSLLSLCQPFLKE